MNKIEIENLHSFKRPLESVQDIVCQASFAEAGKLLATKVGTDRANEILASAQTRHAFDLMDGTIFFPEAMDAALKSIGEVIGRALVRQLEKLGAVRAKVCPPHNYRGERCSACGATRK